MSTTPSTPTWSGGERSESGAGGGERRLQKFFGKPSPSPLPATVIRMAEKIVLPDGRPADGSVPWDDPEWREDLAKRLTASVDDWVTKELGSKITKPSTSRAVVEELTVDNARLQMEVDMLRAGMFGSTLIADEAVGAADDMVELWRGLEPILDAEGYFDTDNQIDWRLRIFREKVKIWKDSRRLQSQRGTVDIIMEMFDLLDSTAE